MLRRNRSGNVAGRRLLFSRCVACVVWLLLVAAFLQGQESPPVGGDQPGTTPPAPTGAANEATPAPADPAAATAELLAKSIPRDIDTASFFQLADWLRQLGLSTKGDRRELMTRLYEHYGLKPPVEKPPETSGRIISIESAGESSYFRIEQADQRYLRLSGGVDLKMTDRKTGEVHEIKADEIVFNQTENILTARGNIRYTITRGTQNELFTGQGLTFRLDNWDGFFIDGTSYRTQQIEGKPFDFSYSGTYISRSKDNIVVLDGGVVTSSQADPPNYEIRAKRIWVLDEGEWGLQDALLYVGRIPVLYLPFFFKPGRQVIFHPALGFRSREGSYLQTTVYLVGQKQDTSSPLSFLQLGEGGLNAPREPNGLFLQLKKNPATGTSPATGTQTTAATPASQAAGSPASGQSAGNPATPASPATGTSPASGQTDAAAASGQAGAAQTPTGAATTGPAAWILKAMADVYTRLGALLALQGDFPAAAPGTNISFYAGLAGSRNLYSSGYGVVSGYSPYFQTSDGRLVSNWNDSSFLGLPIPLRYRLNFDAQTQSPILNLHFQLPYLSDRYFLEDFGNRSEGMDWSQFLGLGSSTKQLPPEIDSFTWQLASSLNLPTAGASPGLSALSITRLNASLAWQSKALGTGDPSYVTPPELQNLDRSPNAYFFYPDLLVLPDIGLHAAGTIAATPTASTTPAANRAAPPSAAQIVPPWHQETASTPAVGGSQLGTAPGGTILPPLQQSIAEANIPNVLTARLGYDFAPGLLLQARTDSGGWTVPSLVDYTTQYWTMQSQDTATLSYGVNLYQNILALNGSLVFSGQYRSVFGRANSVDDPTWTSLTQQAGQFSGLGVTDNLTLTSQPLQALSALSQSTVSYNLAVLIFSRAYASSDANGNPVYANSWTTWDPSSVKTHSLQLTLNAKALAANQQLQLTAVLPPLQRQYTGALDLQTGPFRHQVSAGVLYPLASVPDQLPTFQPVIAAETVTFGTIGSFKQTAQYDPQNDYATQAVSTLSLGPVSAGLTLSRSDSFSFGGVGVGWIDNLDPTFRPQAFSLGVNGTVQPDPFWKNRVTIGAGVTSQWQLNLLRFTDSTFTFGFNFTVKIAKFLDLTFASLSQNNLTFLYIPAFAQKVGRPWRNPLVDLAKSFNFFNTADREESGFKLQQLSLSAVHDLGDWTLSVTYAGSPQLTTLSSGVKQYQWNSQVSIDVVWKPIPEIRTTTQVDQGEIQFNPPPSTTQTTTP
ncbi:MAG TPA: hypothetical protein VMW87_02375 [Spirochaetia bacterium]|nr:hypothetical protein [Spirochaetia bacterium]